MSLTSHISECVLNRACERPPLLDGCALLLKVSRYRAHAPRGLARTPPAVCAASEASRHFLTGAATPPLGGGEYPARTTFAANHLSSIRATSLLAAGSRPLKAALPPPAKQP